MILRNIYVDDCIKKLFFFRQNHLCKKITTEVERIDPVENFEDFKQYVSKEILGRVKRSNKGILYSIRYGEEGQWYGHRSSIFDFAGLKSGNDRYLMPDIWHGAEFVGYDTCRTRFSKGVQYLITMSDYRTDQIHAIRPWLQVYPIGPYICYAKGFYEKSWIEAAKKTNGKTALYFPQHSTETASSSVDESVACENIDYLIERYDTVLVSVYWADVAAPEYDYYLEKGAKLVSSGVRSDINFIRRQKSLFELADDVYGNALGTNLGYAMALGKPYYFFRNDTKIVDNRISDIYIQQFKERESEIMNIWEENDIREKGYVFERFWGGKKYKRTKEEIRSILKIQQKLLNMTCGNIGKMDGIVESVVTKKKRYEFTDDEIRLMSSAVNISRNV